MSTQYYLVEWYAEDGKRQHSLTKNSDTATERLHEVSAMRGARLRVIELHKGISEPAGRTL